MQNARVIGDPPTGDGYTAGSASLAVNTRSGLAPPRMLFIDNVRWAMIMLVLSMHAADTYSPFGNWYYVERPEAGHAVRLFFLTYQTVLQGFFMALLFFVAGYFTPTSFDAKGPGAFLKGRLVRLGLPTLLYVAVIGPVTEFYVAHSWHTTNSFGHEMVLYIVRGRFLSGTGPMWFCAALLIFSGVYVLYRMSGAPAALLRPGKRKVGVSGVVLTIAAIAVATFLARIADPDGTSVFNMEPGDFPSYIVMFGLGVAAGRAGWLQEVSDRFAWTAAGLCVGAAVTMWLPLLLLCGAAAFAGGFHWQGAVLNLWQALICVGMSFGVLAGFRIWLSSQGRISKFMSANAFAVYVVHPPILIGLALVLAGVPIPPVPKFALLWMLSAVVCFGFAAPVARRIPLLGRILQ